MPLTVEIREEHPGVFTVIPSGSIDTETYLDLEEKLNPILSESTKLIIFDMGAVHYISSMGLGVIFKTKSFLDKQGGSLIISNLQPQVKKVMSILKALPEHIFKNMEEVDAYITQIQRKELERGDGSRG
jgi:anti-anti-sigma factor